MEFAIDVLVAGLTSGNPKQVRHLPIFKGNG